MIKKTKEEKTVNLYDFHIEQVENGWLVKAEDAKRMRGWWDYSEEDPHLEPKLYVFEDMHKLITWIEKNV